MSPHNPNIGLIVLSLIILFLGILTLQQNKNARWDHFSELHHCKLVGSAEERTTHIVHFVSSRDPKDTTTHRIEGTEWPIWPAAYECDDGQTYWRE